MNGAGDKAAAAAAGVEEAESVGSAGCETASLSGITWEVGWDGVGSGMGWDAMNWGVGWDGVGWNRMRRGEMGWDGMYEKGWHISNQAGS